jgi:predicted short-subunit dehydrogenase-like oxidoreductase (DUF2520 family)
MKPRIAIVGPGRVGQSIGRLLCRAGYPVSAVVGRDPDATRAGAWFIGAELMATSHLERCGSAEVIFLAVPDDALGAVAEQLAGIALPTGALVVHCSGLHTTGILSSVCASTRDIQTLALHPLQTFASPAAGYEALPGSYCSLQGDADALERGHRIAVDLGCHPFVIDAGHKIRYHAAACMVSNYITALIDAATELCADIPDADNIFPAAFKPLLEAAVRNSVSAGPTRALTGPVARGDSGTLKAHIQALKKDNPDLLPLYRILGQHTLGLAEKGHRLDSEHIEELRTILSQGGNL